MERLADQARAKPIPAGLWGIATLISVITLGKLSTSAIMIGGALFVLAATLFGLLVTYGSKLIVAYDGQADPPAHRAPVGADGHLAACVGHRAMHHHMSTI